MELVRQLAGLSVSHIRQFRDDDSYIDRLSHRYTAALCVFFAILVSTKQYAGKIIFFYGRIILFLLFIGDPIDCWVQTYDSIENLTFVSLFQLGTSSIQTLV